MHTYSELVQSGDAVPDILDEAWWNLEWMLAMQDPGDGGVYHKLTNLRFDGEVMPEAEVQEAGSLAQAVTAYVESATARTDGGARPTERIDLDDPDLDPRLLCRRGAPAAVSRYALLLAGLAHEVGRDHPGLRDRGGGRPLHHR